MKIYTNKSTNLNLKSKPTVPASKQVDRIGKYLYKNLYTAIDFKKTANSYDVYTELLYEVPYLQKIPGRGKEYNGLHSMIININITTYQNKIRVNVIEMDPKERTLGFDLYLPETVEDLEFACKLIYQKVCKRVAKAYATYDFVF